MPEGLGYQPHYEPILPPVTAPAEPAIPSRAPTAKEKVVGKFKETGEKLWNNKQFIASFVAGMGLTLGLAEGLHQPNVALTFPALTTLLGEAPIALTTLYRAIKVSERQRIGKSKNVLEKILLVPNITQEKINRLEKWPHRRFMNWLTDKVSTLTYRKYVHSFTGGQMAGIAVAGAMELGKMVHANQPAAQPAPAENDAVSRHPGGVTNPPAGGGEPPKPITNPAPGMETNPALIPPEKLEPASDGKTGVIRSYPMPPEAKVVAEMQQPIVINATREGNSVWMTSRNWLQPITDHLHLSPQAQTYLTDAVKDVMEKYYHGLQPGQTIDFKPHIPEIVSYVKQAIQVNSPNIAGGSVDPSLTGLNVSDLQTFLSKGVDLLNKIPK
mgnify:CR=1 FL=1